MAEIKVKRGYNLHLAGKSDAQVVDAPFPKQVAIRPSDLGELKLRVLVKDGDPVQVGSPLMELKSNPDIKFTSPAGGKVAEVRRGDRRKLLQIIINVEPNEQSVDFGTTSLPTASREQVLGKLLASGLFAKIRQHPFARMASPTDTPKGIFVSGFSSAPMGIDLNLAVAGKGEALNAGLAALAKLTSGRVHLSKPARGTVAPEITSATSVESHSVSGKHPAGSAPLQAYYIDRVRAGEVIWYVDIQDVIAIGKLMQTGKISSERIVSLAGPGIAPAHRKHYRTRAGVMVGILLSGKLVAGEQRIISGDILTGSKIADSEPIGFFDSQITVVPEGRQREILGWLLPGLDKHSYSRTFLSALKPPSTEWQVDTNLHGGHRACIQCGFCNDVCPTEVLALPTWKAVSYGDLEEAEQLGITDCIGCGLCTYVCPSKIEIDSILEAGLAKIQKEG
ncbi:Na(+)-translocating NADH-quinone reductase subunit A [bacterium]|nr:Na(+)-translocating NADH-quinone reductase subunit A [bacterium]